MSDKRFVVLISCRVRSSETQYTQYEDLSIPVFAGDAEAAADRVSMALQQLVIDDGKLMAKGGAT